jgi:hypothetical protein
VVAVAFILWQLHRRSHPARAPSEGSPENLLAFQRAEIVRQRDALKAVPLWYIAPIVPSFVLVGIGRWIQEPVPHRAPQLDHMMILAGGVIGALILVVVWLLNVVVVAKLDREIDKIDRLLQG